MAMFRRADVPIVQFYCPEHGPMSVLAEQASRVADSTGYSALVACKGHVLEVELDAQVPDASDVVVGLGSPRRRSGGSVGVKGHVALRYGTRHGAAGGRGRHPRSRSSGG